MRLKPTDSRATLVIGTTGRRVPHLAALLRTGRILVPTRRGAADAPDQVVTFAPSGARRLPAHVPVEDLPLFLACDGLLASVGPMPDAPAVSALFARVAPADLARLATAGFDVGSAAFSACVAAAAMLRTGADAGAGEPLDVDAAIAAIRAAGLTHMTMPARHCERDTDGTWKVLLAQTAGAASPAADLAVLDAALAAHAAADIVLLPAPAAAPDGAFAAEAARRGVDVLAPEAPLAGVLARAGEVWTLASVAGWDALVHGRPVRVFGAPFYAGWGFTRDTPLAPADRERLKARRPLAFADLFALVAGAMTHYADPVTRRRVDLGAAIDRLADWAARQAARTGPVVCAGFTRWKRPIAQSFFGGAGAEVIFAPVARAPAIARRKGASIHVWGARTFRRLRADLDATGEPKVRLCQVEDGFIRSVGLGSELNRPASLTIDDIGIYYDATAPSRLESLLQEREFDATTLERARQLRVAVRALGISKYNVRGEAPLLPASAHGRRRVLVVGQVPNDASLVHGRAMFGGDNLAFLAAVRRAEPDTFLIYKEHPDVVRRNRPGWLREDEVLPHADLFLRAGDTTQLLGEVDHLHTMTSLAGFEALIHEVPVTCWGVPFYAGWGLTDDRLACGRRSRRRTLDELVAAALIDYPVYLEPASEIPCRPEDIVATIGAARRATGDPADAGWRLAAPLSGLFRARIRLLARLQHPLVVRRRRRIVLKTTEIGTPPGQ